MRLGNYLNTLSLLTKFPHYIQPISTLTGLSTPAIDNLLSANQYRYLCKNQYSRFHSNPEFSVPLLLHYDESKQSANAIVYQFLFPNQDLDIPTAKGYSNQFVKVPKIALIDTLSSEQDSDGLLHLYGYTQIKQPMSGRPLCTIEYTEKGNAPKKYLFYSLKPRSSSQIMPKSIARLQNSEEASLLERLKGGHSKESDLLAINNEDVCKRLANKTRGLSQNQVMGLSAVDEYRICSEKYARYLNPELISMLQDSALSARTENRPCNQQNLSAETHDTMNEPTRFSRPEWLHRLAFFSHPLDQSPQNKLNLGAARAGDNTRMMLLESVLRWFCLKVPYSKNYLYSRFDLLLDTNVIDRITLSVLLGIADAQCKLTQEIDTLKIGPDPVIASDMAELITTLIFLFSNTSPLLKKTVAINPNTKPPLFFSHKQPPPEKAVERGALEPSTKKTDLPAYDSRVPFGA